MLCMIFQYGWEMVLIQRILIGWEAKLEILLSFISFMPILGWQMISKCKCVFGCICVCVFVCVSVCVFVCVSVCVCVFVWSRLNVFYQMYGMNILISFGGLIKVIYRIFIRHKHIHTFISVIVIHKCTICINS